ncbi:TolB family protein [Emticicia sp. SJ17W-69]|uniref:TolB family protein n=1 Tax=Emticicia sp. SJ17W-69 TaxID=3421657 RepID=UPI003EB7AA50
MKLKTIVFFIIATNWAFAQLPNKIGLFEERTDIGNPTILGKTTYNPNSQEYIMEGAGINMWEKTDQFNFLWKKIKGDFIISATVQFVGKGVNPHRKIGIMARNSLQANSAYVDASVHGVDLTSLQYRESAGEDTKQIELSSFNPVAIEFQRIGNEFTFSAATKGENYKSFTKEIKLNEEVFAGLFICSHEEKVLEKAIFNNVRITIPAAKDFRPYRDYIGSQIEIMEVKTGLRKILYSAKNSLQAPNWTKDGKYLLYNCEGLMYRYSIADGKVEVLNTGLQKQNNNDHAISFDGKMLAISNYFGEKRTSTIYILPTSGSDKPVQLTNPELGHSWLHSWSPDGKKLIYMGERNKQPDIWSIDIATKKETALTNTPTLDDGPEYTPDGKYIYFNSVRTGTMKIWRMKPDGSNQEQVTFDQYNDWFPHFSPDGKQLLYISFPPDIKPTDHPFYKKVVLRLMPTSGGVPQTIAYIYGGQGTINTPSWSPDGKYVAFVSNTKID